MTQPVFTARTLYAFLPIGTTLKSKYALYGYKDHAEFQDFEQVSPAGSIFTVTLDPEFVNNDWQYSICNDDIKGFPGYCTGQSPSIHEIFMQFELVQLGDGTYKDPNPLLGASYMNYD